jgi:hypothetical protein
MRKNVHNLLTLPIALYTLARLGIATNFRLRGKYWTWRWQTAWGSGEQPSSKQKWAAALEYARWVAKMKRL